MDKRGYADIVFWLCSSCFYIKPKPYAGNHAVTYFPDHTDADPDPFTHQYAHANTKPYINTNPHADSHAYTDK